MIILYELSYWVLHHFWVFTEFNLLILTIFSLNIYPVLRTIGLWKTNINNEISKKINNICYLKEKIVLVHHDLDYDCFFSPQLYDTLRKVEWFNYSCHLYNKQTNKIPLKITGLFVYDWHFCLKLKYFYPCRSHGYFFKIKSLYVYVNMQLKTVIFSKSIKFNIFSKINTK